MTTIGRNVVRRLIDAGTPVVEVLPEKEYAEEHLPGAINIPLKVLTRQSVSRLAPEQPVIVYCWDSQ